VNNPRTHSRAQVASIAESMREFGWTNPILVGTDDDIIAGHPRLLAAEKFGMKEVPVILLKHLSPAQRRALVIADNQLAIEGAGWDEEMLRVELAILHEEDYNLDLVGFDDVELQRLLEAQDNAPGLTDADAVPRPKRIRFQSRATCGSWEITGSFAVTARIRRLSRASSVTRSLSCLSPTRRMELSSIAGLNGHGGAEPSYMKHRYKKSSEVREKQRSWRC